MPPFSVAYDEAAALRDPAVRLGPAFAAAAAEAMRSVAPRYPSWRSLARVMSNSEAVERRIAAMNVGVKLRVDFKRVLQRHAQARFPGFEAGYAGPDFYRYARPIGEDLALTIEWRHISGNGIGKILEVHVGARFRDKGAVVSRPLPWFWGFAETAAWTYSTKEDLEACLDAAADFLDLALPPLGATLASLMADGAFSGAGACTAREAFSIAQEASAQILGSRAPALAGAEARQSTGHWGPIISPDGRVRAHAEWLFHFRADGGALSVAVPHLGPPRCLKFARALSTPELLPEPWIDSSKALGAAARHPGFRPGATPTGLTLGYYRPYTARPCWRVDFVMIGAGQRALVWIDAETGEAIHH